MGGAELQIRYLMEYLSQNPENEITYICRNVIETGSLKEKIIRLKPLPYLKKFSKAIDAFQIRRAILKLKPDVIYIRGDSPYLGIAVCCKKRIPVNVIWHIAHIRDVKKFKVDLASMESIFRFIDRKIFERGIAGADYIIAQADYQQKLLKQNFNTACSETIYNFHPFHQYKKTESNSVLTISWIANIKPAKKVDHFLKLASKFSDQENVQFKIAGDCQYPELCSAIKNACRQQQNIHYYGKLDINDINSLLNDSDIFVSTSDSEGFPNTFIHAWLHAVPVLSLNFDPDDIIRKYGLGLVSNDFESLVQNLNRLISDTQLRKNLGKNGYDFALRNFNNENLHRLSTYFYKKPVAKIKRS